MFSTSRFSQLPAEDLESDSFISRPIRDLESEPGGPGGDCRSGVEVERVRLVSADGPSGADRARTRRVLTVSLSVLFASAVMMDLFGKKAAIGAPSFPYTFTQLSPFVGFIAYGAACVWAWHRGGLHRDAMQFPKRKAFLVGVLFSSHNVLQNLGNRGNVVPGALVVMIAKLIVPMSFGLEMVPPLSKRHNRWRFAGCGILLAGIGIAVVPSFESLRHFDFGSELGRVILLVLVRARWRLCECGVLECVCCVLCFCVCWCRRWFRWQWRCCMLRCSCRRSIRSCMCRTCGCGSACTSFGSAFHLRS